VCESDDIGRSASIAASNRSTIGETTRDLRENSIARYWRYVLMFSIESSCVIVLRTMKLARGGVPALDEACRIVTEKAVAMGETSVRAARGKGPLALALAYRRAVRSNLRRLSR
jgi:hypothetical protein